MNAFIKAIEAKKKLWLQDKILIRFGHATHTTPEQAVRMRELGIYADINLGSNLRTGAIAYLEEQIVGTSDEDSDSKEQARHKYMEGIKKQNKQWNLNPSELIQKDHGLANLLLAEVKVVLGTDGQGVEVTSIKDEYELLENYLYLHPKLSSNPTKYFDQIVNNSLELRNLMLA
ncbi:hypothetical protein VB834_14875 [Limnoraphis robusta Tam1]|uniref:Uncharacterized protein n=1 Tax=Limnoraphis robusta CCNP1315 TaxID=3110306 RepID=A0ABU5U2D9_9CYAN|nr:hypothetical protein [Limnoraphis robusta]MEA5498285.1 hypothetical protein [Limnoraphis robusta BA-68 BA1]MEA5521357.1 hypothetical protein [Limnoraphis robusta CCNP1315]MEA5540308.1 hypothetical protein [Limnoraphis robusta Tam1]MEA5547966.1 hypothetical protein [Limnoraphis robusta CCNP1324]